MNLSHNTSEVIDHNFLVIPGIKFKNQNILVRALTHRSYLNEHLEALEDNERLEFLGDAILDFLVGAWLYNHFPEMREGELTRLRSALVKTQQLADFARQINLGEVVLLGKGEEENNGRERDALLCATFEALIGAIYLDKDINEVKIFIEPFLEQATQNILEQRSEYDPKSVLQEWAQAQGFNPPIYKVLSTSGPDHNKIFIIEVLVDGVSYGMGEGNSKRQATKSAAQVALQFLNIG